MMLSKYKSIRNLAMMALIFTATLATAQTTATGVINATLVNKNGISLQFDTDPGGVTLGAAGTSAAVKIDGTSARPAGSSLQNYTDYQLARKRRVPQFHFCSAGVSSWPTAAQT